jgi:Protein of unknown function (DUF559)
MTGNGSKKRARALAERQAGRLSQLQLAQIGVARGTVSGWLMSGDLVRELPRVFAFGHTQRTLEGKLWSAVLYAGPCASLTGIAGAHQRGLLNYPASQIEINTPRRCRSLPGIIVHGRRPPSRDIINGLPIAPLPQLMLDLAANGRPKPVRRALACLDYQGILRPPELLSACGHGRPGSGLLRWAIVRYDPRFAHTNGPLEEDYLIIICEGLGVPPPDAVDVWIEGIECDAVYYDARLIVQLDGEKNHGSSPKKLIDHHNDLVLRSHGWFVLRYSWAMVHTEGRDIANEILRKLA